VLRQQLGVTLTYYYFTIITTIKQQILFEISKKICLEFDLKYSELCSIRTQKPGENHA